MDTSRRPFHGESNPKMILQKRGEINVSKALISSGFEVAVRNCTS